MSAVPDLSGNGLGSEAGEQITRTNVAAATSAQTLLAANALRKQAHIVNDSTDILYVLLGSGTPSSTNYTFAIDGKTTVPGMLSVSGENWLGVIKGIWSGTNGSARMTEIA